MKLLNHERALEVMARADVDGLVAATPINTYYVSSYWGLLNLPAGFDGTYFAVLPADAGASARLVLPAFEQPRLAALESSDQGTWTQQIHEYTGDEQDPAAAGGSFDALAAALRSAGLHKCCVATDDARVADWLRAAGLESLTVRFLPDLFREIRLIKTEAEIEIMRHAARINELALMVAADAFTDGAPVSEIENLYMLSMAQQGGRGIYLLCGGLAGLPGGVIRPGVPVSLDALGQYRHYHGDFGRNAVLGEPTREQKVCHAKLLVGWEAAQDLLRPGAGYRDVAAGVGTAVREAGLSDFSDPLVHSLGLEHTDDPREPGVLPQHKPDRVLEPNMVVNVDMPYTQPGWGTVHMEDTVRITTYGYERLGRADTLLRIAELES